MLATGVAGVDAGRIAGWAAAGAGIGATNVWTTVATGSTTVTIGAGAVA